MEQLSFDMKINNELKLEDILNLLKEKVNSMELDEKVEAINSIKEALTEVSPFEEPVDCVRWIKADKVIFE